MYLYLVIDERNVVVGRQTSPRNPIERDNYIEVDEATYNLSPGNYETMIYYPESGEFEILPDPRPVLELTVDSDEVRVGHKVNVGLDIVSHGTDLTGYGLEDHRLQGDSIFYLDYQSPEGRLGCIRAELKNGKARDTGFTTRVSGMHMIKGNRLFREVAPVEIIVYEE